LSDLLKACEPLRFVANFRDFKIPDQGRTAIFMDEVKRDRQADTKLRSIQQIAERYDVSKTTVHDWMKKGLINGFKQGKGRFFYLHELDQRLTDYKYFKMLQDTGEIPKGKSYMEYHKERKSKP
jgi:helix-turn-helix protein